MADIHQEKADNLRVKLLKGAIDSLGKELNEIEHVLLAGTKDPMVFTKVKLDLPLLCESCDEPYKGYSIIDSYQFDAKGGFLQKNSLVICKRCLTKLKVQL